MAMTITNKENCTRSKGKWFWLTLRKERKGEWLINRSTVLKVLQNLYHLISSIIWRISLGQFSPTLLPIRNTWELYKITTPRKALPKSFQRISGDGTQPLVIFKSPQVISLHSQVWESRFQNSLSLFCNDTDILREEWTCLRVPSWWMVKLWFRPGSAFLQTPVIIFLIMLLSPPEVCCLWLSQSFLVASL